MSAMYFLDFFFFSFLLLRSVCFLYILRAVLPFFLSFLFFFISFYDTQCLSLYILKISFGFNGLVDLYQQYCLSTINVS